ncbi:MAG: hypothetical protein EOO03_05755 [Chitinophagaceae bacterium]|nr:MAG: hypothetical protein EOO03_05755 [Chitinophagaceae bacterium]
MRKNVFQVLVAVCLVAGIFLSCDSRNSTQPLNTKSDSLAFARTVMQAYGSEALMQEEQQPPAQTRNLMGADSMQPISWATFEQYKKAYDKSPKIFNLQNQPYKGFTIDATGYSKLQGNPTIKGLYLRLGLKEDGSYTIMVLGTGASGQVLTTLDTLVTGNGDDGTNYDNLRPCPSHCPDIDD